MLCFFIKFLIHFFYYMQNIYINIYKLKATFFFYFKYYLEYNDFKIACNTNPKNILLL